MITRSKLVEQLRDYQMRSQHKWAALTIFSSKPLITKRADIVAALLWALLFCVLVIFSYMTLYFRYFRVSAGFICLGILLPMCLKVCRQRSLARKREPKIAVTFVHVNIIRFPKFFFAKCFINRGYLLTLSSCCILGSPRSICN